MLLFIDESGHDRKQAPYEILAGVSVREVDLWNLIQEIRALEIKYFGLQMSSVGLELKGRKLLKTKTFRLASQTDEIESSIRLEAVRSFLQKGWREANGGILEPRTSTEYASYGQAVLAFVKELLDIAKKFQVKVFASIVSKAAPRPIGNEFLRKDYAYLFERFFYYLEEVKEIGLVVFDELEKAQSRILLGQMERYFKGSGKGRQRSARIVPEPFFVHSDLTTLVQLADIVGYCLNWGARINRNMVEPIRQETRPYAQKIMEMQYKGRKSGLFPWQVYGVIYLDDLRPKDQK